MKIFRAIGLMSGTSMDGVDIALIETDGEKYLHHGPAGFLAYDEQDRAVLRAALANAVTLTQREDRPDAIATAESIVTRRHAQAIECFLRDNHLDARDIDLIGFHGQTILHRPRQKLTIQIGDGPALARSTGISVAFDFRAADVAAGGEGAPLVPVYHRALAEASNESAPVVFLNIGGVANITYIDAGTDPIACDTGPGNALLDDLMLAFTGEPIDRHGLTAARGRVNEAALVHLLAHPFFRRPPPKSLDRNAFSRQILSDLLLEDAAATLTAFTAASVLSILPHLPAMPGRIVLCGGGSRNPILVRELVRRAPCKVTTADASGWSSDAMEARAFAYLAVRSLRRLPITFPATTGVAHPMTGGLLAHPSARTISAPL